LNVLLESAVGRRGREAAVVIIQGEVRIHPDDMDKLREAARDMIRATRAEEGCIVYAYGEDVLDPGLIHVVERWRDEAAVASHAQSAHMAAFNAALAKARVLAVKIIAFDASGERVLIGG
jgi:quinol monooxygenase YgiN